MFKHICLIRKMGAYFDRTVFNSCKTQGIHKTVFTLSSIYALYKLKYALSKCVSEKTTRAEFF